MTDFNWSLLDRETLYYSMYKIKNQIANKSLKISTFHQIISKHVKRTLPIKVKKELNYNVLHGQVEIGGSYYGYLDKQNLKSIELCLAYHPNDQFVKLSIFQFTRFCKVFADTVLHEIIHMRQYRRRKFKYFSEYKNLMNKEQIYLANKDEIGAYGFTIACELHDKFKGNSKKIVAYLNENQRSKLKGSNSWIIYLREFNYDPYHPVLQRVKKRVIYYISRNQLSKPFQTKNWLSS